MSNVIAEKPQPSIPEVEEIINFSGKASQEDVFDIINEKPRKPFVDIDKDTRKRLFKNMQGKRLNIEYSDFISLNGCDIQFEFLPEAGDQACDLKLNIMDEDQSRFLMERLKESRVIVLNPDSFVVKTFVKLNDDKVKSRNYSLVFTFIKSRDQQKHVCSFSLVNLQDDEKKKWRVLYGHRSTGTGGGGRY